MITFEANVDNINRKFQLACEIGDLISVQNLLQDWRVDPKLSALSAIDYAICPYITDSYCLQIAAYNGHLDVVRLLLSDGRADPTASDFRCIRLIINRASQDYSNKKLYKNILWLIVNHCWYNNIYIKDTLYYQLACIIWSNS